MALFPASGLAPAPMNMRVHRQKEVYKVRKRDRSVANLFVHERNSRGRDSGARRDVGTLRLKGRGSPKGSGEVLADVARHLEHVEARNREDGLKLRIRLDGPALVKRVLLDVNPDELGHLRAGRRLLAADGSERVAELLRSEDALARLLHGKRVPLARRLRGRLAHTALLPH